jgi:diacylglycerol kinase family enzyme
MLVVNPVTKGAAGLRARLGEMVSLLRGFGYELDMVETTPEAGSAAQLTVAAIADGASTVFACGGDGTVHGVVQGLAQTGIALGVLPLGTANALARNLGLPLDVGRALAVQAMRNPVAIPLGVVENAGGAEWFCLMAGCGPDGALAHTLATSEGLGRKKRMGRMAYYAEAARLFSTRRWPEFCVEYRAMDEVSWRCADAVAMMCSRVPNLGGLFSGTTRAARLTDERLHVTLVHGPGHVALPMWMVCGRLGIGNPWATVVDAAEVRCSAPKGGIVQAQVDAEPLRGGLPMTLRLVPRALHLLMPQG